MSDLPRTIREMHAAFASGAASPVAVIEQYLAARAGDLDQRADIASRPRGGGRRSGRIDRRSRERVTAQHFGHWNPLIA